MSSEEPKQSPSSEHPQHIPKPEVSDSAAGALAALGRSFARAVAFFGRGSVAGTLSGIVEETAGYPLDLIKTRVQVKPQASAIAELKYVLEHSGFAGLFKGLGPPLIASAGLNAVLFGGYSNAKAQIQYWEPNTAPLFVSALSGAFGGVLHGLAVCPVDRIKCIMQVHGGGHGGTSGPGMVATAVDVVKHGGIRSLFLGMGPTLLRDIPGYAIFFGIYDGLKSSLAKLNAPGELKAHGTEGEEEDEHSAGPLAVIVAGGTAGTVYSCGVHPLDVIKSILQTQPPGTKLYRGAWHCAQQVVNEHGFRSLFRGLGPVAVQAFPAHAIGFVVYEAVLRLLPEA